MSTFPSVLTTFTTRLNGQVIDAGDVNGVQSGVTQLERVVGAENSASVVGTIQYFIKSPASDGGGHIQSANKGGTGQTVYTKGDILVAQSSSVLTKLSAGTVGQALKVNSATATGLEWASAAVNVTSFLSTGVWTKPTTLTGAQVICIGAGGGGGGGKSTGGTTGTGGAGGGGGALTMHYFPSSWLTSSVFVGIGAAGTGGGTSMAGTAGGTTAFGSLLTAFGGGGGSGAIADGTAYCGGGGGGSGGVGPTATTSTSSVIGGSPQTLYANGISGQGAGAGVTAGYAAEYGGGGGGGGNNGGNGFNGGNSLFGGGGGGGGGGSAGGNVGGYGGGQGLYTNGSGAAPGTAGNFLQGGGGGGKGNANGRAGGIGGGGGGGGSDGAGGAGGNGGAGAVYVIEY